MDYDRDRQFNRRIQQNEREIARLTVTGGRDIVTIIDAPHPGFDADAVPLLTQNARFQEWQERG